MTAFSKKTIRICEIVEQQGIMTPEEQKNINSAFRSARRRGLLILACGQFGYQYRVAPDWRAKVKEAATPKFKRINPLRCPANSIFQVGEFVRSSP